MAHELCKICEEDLDTSDHWEVLKKSCFYYHRDCYARYSHGDIARTKALARSLLQEAILGVSR